MILIAILNGTARDLWYKNHVGELLGHQISTISLIILFSIYIWFILKKYPPKSNKQSIHIGVLWLILTLIFEFGFGTLQGNSLKHMLNEYNVLEGRIWVLVPIWIFIAPYLFFKIKKHFSQ